MRFLRAVLMGCSLGFLTCCCTIIVTDLSFVPKKSGIDPKAKPYVDKWMNLAKEKGLIFDHNVSVNFENIDKDSIVGICHYGLGFREITLDNKYWNTYSDTKKFMLVLHESGHCNCNRVHGWTENHIYENDGGYLHPGKDGFFKDGCPITVMFPYNVEDFCYKAHYSEYIKDMLDKCKAY